MLDKFMALEPQTVANYLRKKHWEESDVEDHHSIWTLQHPSQGDYILLLPLNREYVDFADRMYDVVRALAVVELRLECEIFNELIRLSKIPDIRSQRMG